MRIFTAAENSATDQNPPLHNLRASAKVTIFGPLGGTPLVFDVWPGELSIDVSSEFLAEDVINHIVFISLWDYGDISAKSQGDIAIILGKTFQIWLENCLKIF